MSTAKQQIAVWGAGGHASVVLEILSLRGWSVTALVVDDEFLPEAPDTEGLPVLGGESALRSLRERNVRHAAVAIGDNAARLRICDALERAGFELPTLLHPAAHVAATAALGAGVLVAAGAMVGPRAAIGRCCILNTASSVDHHCVLGDAVHVAPGARLAGGVRVGEGCLVGIGACVIDHVEVGARAVIGAGAAVVADIPADVVAMGVPARPVREL